MSWCITTGIGPLLISLLAAGGSVTPGSSKQVTIAIAGDIAQAGRVQHARAIAALIAKRNQVSALLLTGDISRYSGQDGLLKHFNTFYKPADQANWGQFDSIAFPSPGNHEYLEKDARGYFDYFKQRLSAIAALPSYHGYGNGVGQGYYSLDLNGWHLVSLNSECESLSDKSCAAGSAMEKFLKADLAAHANMPILAFWHVPRYTCGSQHRDDRRMEVIWADLYAARADLVFNGHSHYYQRFRPMNDGRALDPQHGLTEIITGSGGVEPRSTCPDGADPLVAKQLGGEAGMGVFFLSLGSDGRYSFEYQLRSDGSIFDKGEGRSHHAR